MPTFKPMKFAAVAVAVCGVLLGAQLVQAKEKAQKTEEKDSSSEAKRARPATTSKVKAGDACKTDADCDPSATEMVCARSKCEYDLSKAHPET